jgi:hypothetical protein
MSNTSKYKPRPYVNSVVGEQLYHEEVEHTKLKEQKEAEEAAFDPHAPAGQGTHGAGDKATSLEVDYEKRWKDLKKHYDTEVSRLRQNVRDLEDSSTVSFTPPKTEEDLEKFRQQNPEFYDVMLSLAHSQVTRSGDQLSEMRRKIEDMEQEKALALIARHHPDFETIVKDPKFNAWLEVQDSTIQSWVKDNHDNANAFIRAIDLYKLDAGITKSSSKKQLKETKSVDTSAAQDVSVSGNSVTVGDTGKRIWSRAEIKRMTPAQFEKFDEEITAAMREGRIR